MNKKNKLLENWAVISGIGSLISFLLTIILLDGNWKISLIISITTFIILIWSNPKKRFMRAFYIVLVHLISNIYFNIYLKTENFDIQTGIKESDVATTIFLGLIAIICLVLDYLERKGKLEGTIFSIRNNKVGDVTGDNNEINQTNV